MANTRTANRPLWLLATVALSSTIWSTQARADALLDHLTSEGRLPRRGATSVVRKVTRVMTANADRGGNDYDSVRQAIGVALFGPNGAGDTLEEYNARLEEVRAKLSAGLDLWSLAALFGEESTANCRRDFRLSAKDCRALSAAAHAPAPVVDVEELLADARIAFQSGDFAAASAAYEQVTRARPADAAAFSGLGQSRARLGDGRGAATALRRAIELAPTVANLRAYLGRALMSAGDRTGAASAFREALTLNSNHADAKAGLRELEGNSTARVTPMPVAAAPAPSSSAPRFGTPRFGTPQPAPVAVAPAAPASAPAFGTPRFGGAPAPARSGGNPAAVQWVQKGDAHLRARQFSQALAAYQMGASFDPNNPAAFAGMGAASMGTGDRAGAARAMQTAVRLAPDSADYNAGLGTALAATGDVETAKAAYRRALGITPGHRAAAAGLAQLEGAAPAPTVVASVAPVPPPQRFSPAQAAPASTTAPEPTPAPMPVAAPTPAPVAAEAPEPEPEPAPEPEPVAPEPTVEEDDLIAGLLSDPLGPTPTRSRSRASSPAPVAAAAAPASGGGGSLPQSPSRDQISEVMRGLLETVKACMPDQSGVVSVQISIAGASGEVTEAEVVGRDADDPEAICVSEVVRGGVFPRFAKDKLSIKFPFRL